MDTAAIIDHYFTDLNAVQRKQFALLGPLYQEWNQKINVISRKDIDHLYLHHVLHSLGIAKIIPFKPGADILDVGTGGGFPGIPLAILFPETNFHLLDSIGKKIAVVKAVADSLVLKNVKAQQARVEETRGRFDFIVSRAVSRMEEFYGWVKDKSKGESLHSLDNGILYLKGGDLEEELDALKKPFALYSLSDYFQEPFFETKKVVFIPL